MISTQNHHQTTTRQHLQAYSYPTTLDADELQELPSLSPSPISQYSNIYHPGTESHSSIATSRVPAIAIPRSIGDIEGPIDGTDLSLGDYTQPMNSGNWNPTGGPFRPKLSRGNHNRESSLSSLGSAGPTSPFSHSGITPRIAIADAGHDGLHGMSDYPHDGIWPEANYALDSKAAPVGQAPDHFFPGLLDGQGYQSMPFVPSAVAQRLRVERGGGLAPPAEFPNISRHGAESVASSTIGGDSPATPAMGEPIEDRRRPDVFREPPKSTDAYQDSVYNNMAVGSSPTSQQHFSTSFSRAIEAANSQHLHVDQPLRGGYRGSSPFRNGSPLAPMASRDFPPASRFHVTPRRSDLHAAHGASPTTTGPSETPQTISPKDAVLELDDVDGDDQYALFHSQPTGGYGGQDQFMRDASAAAGHFQYMGAANPTADVPVPQQYSFMPSPMHTDHSRRLLESPSTTSHQETVVMPRGTVDDGGTYSCTYHGCKLRFDTQKDLQTHKREGHRAAGVARRGDRKENQQTQHGPHICNRINPSTNKVCGSKFSRPYDLTRHEDTIHNASKKKLRCRICPEEKLFSRRDALNRHFKVCHEELYETEFPRRRRANRS